MASVSCLRASWRSRYKARIWSEDCVCCTLVKSAVNVFKEMTAGRGAGGKRKFERIVASVGAISLGGL